MYLAYTYLITNKITHQFYYGSRCRNVKFKRSPEKDFWIKYFTSSKDVKALVEEYGRDSFNTQIIMKDVDYDKCYLYEQELINSHLNEELCLNRHCQLTGKFSMAGATHSAETKVKISTARKGRPISDEQKVKISAARKNQVPPMSGKKCSEETKNKLRIANSGQSSPMKGRKHSEETKSKIAAAKIGNTNAKKP